MKLPRNNKKGITLVEVIVGVFVLSIFALGILSLLIYNNQAVSDSAVEKADYSAAVQKLDMVIAAVSNSLGPDADDYDATISYLSENGSNIEVDIAGLRDDFGMSDATVWDIDADPDPDPEEAAHSTEPLRGWYITLTYKVKRTERGTETDYTTVVRGYAAFAQGEFDK